MAKNLSEKGVGCMRVCGRFPNSPARATTVLGLGHFRATSDGGVLPCQDHLRECSRSAVYRRAPKYRLPPRPQTVGKSWQFSKLPADPGMDSMMALDDGNINARGLRASWRAMRVCGRFQTLLRARDHTVDELRTVTVLTWERFRPGARGRFPNSPARARQLYWGARQLYWGWSTFAPPNLVCGFRRKANAIPQSDL
jgi:hypothetical protein